MRPKRSKRLMAQGVIRRYRQFLGLTQAQFAARLNTTLVTVARLETSHEAQFPLLGEILEDAKQEERSALKSGDHSKLRELLIIAGELLRLSYGKSEFHRHLLSTQIQGECYGLMRFLRERFVSGVSISLADITKIGLELENINCLASQLDPIPLRAEDNERYWELLSEEWRRMRDEWQPDSIRAPFIGPSLSTVLATSDSPVDAEQEQSPILSALDAYLGAKSPADTAAAHRHLETLLAERDRRIDKARKAVDDARDADLQQRRARAEAVES